MSNLARILDRVCFTSPFGEEVDRLRSGEGAFTGFDVSERPPHPALRADLSPKGEVRK